MPRAGQRVALQLPLIKRLQNRKNVLEISGNQAWSKAIAAIAPSRGQIYELEIFDPGPFDFRVQVSHLSKVGAAGDPAVDETGRVLGDDVSAQLAVLRVLPGALEPE